MTSPSLPEPQVNADSAAFWQACREGRLLLRRCCACGHTHYPPRHVCPRCWSDTLEWSNASGRGTVYTFTIMQRAPTPEFVHALPYVVALIDLIEGPRMMANIVGAETMAVAIGDTVELTFEPRGNLAVPQFKRVLHTTIATER